MRQRRSKTDQDGARWQVYRPAYLAREGFTGAPAITMDDPDLAWVWGDQGRNWYIEQQYTKLYLVCRWAQPAAEAALALVRDHTTHLDQRSK